MEVTKSTINPQPHPFPQDLRKELPDYWTPWGISKRLFEEMKQQKGVYKKAQILPSDPEWRFIWKYFYHDKPKRWGIKQMYCIHERHQQQAFELNLSSIERETTKFKPTWDQEPRAPQRAKAIERWKESTNAFSPFNTLENDGRRRDWKETKILPLWHGSSETAAHSVAESGFVFFGKTTLGGAATKSTDEGFFGSGIYFTNSARYAADIYSSGHLLMAWVSMREPFPVVGDDLQTDMNTLKGKGAYKAYNAHYVPVASADPSNPYEVYYYPTKPGQDPHCDEIVVFHKSQAIPRFWVEIEVEAPYLMVPSNIPQFVNELIPHLFKILENQNVDRDQKLRDYLGEELGFLLKLKGNDYLDDYGNKYEILYGQLTQLIDTQGKVNRAVSRALTGSSLPTSPTISPQVQPINHSSSLFQIQTGSFLNGNSFHPQQDPQLSDRSLPSQKSKKTKKSKKPKPLPSNPTEQGEALYDYTGTQGDGTLSFKKGDKINITQKTGDWWMGELKGKTGYVPSNFIQLLPQSTLPSLPLPQKPTPIITNIKPKDPIIAPVLTVKLPAIAFGKAKWATYFGDIGEEPPLPNDIDKILASPCPFWTGKKVQDTHLLVLIPKTVNGQLLTLANLKEWIQKPKQGHATKFREWYPYGNENLSVAQSYWVLMTRDVLEGTRKKSYVDQTKIVSGLCKKTGIDYQVPTLLEAATCILMEYVSKGTRLYSDSPLTFTRCQEKYENHYQMVIGGFAVGGPVVYYRSIVIDGFGLACLRKF